MLAISVAGIVAMAMAERIWRSAGRTRTRDASSAAFAFRSGYTVMILGVVCTSFRLSDALLSQLFLRKFPSSRSYVHREGEVSSVAEQSRVALVFDSPLGITHVAQCRKERRVMAVAGGISREPG